MLISDTGRGSFGSFFAGSGAGSVFGIGVHDCGLGTGSGKGSDFGSGSMSESSSGSGKPVEGFLQQDDNLLIFPPSHTEVAFSLLQR